MKLFRKLLEFMKTKFWRGLFSSKIQSEQRNSREKDR